MTKVQRFWRSIVARDKLGEINKRKIALEMEEREWRTRRRRIQDQQRELQILRNLNGREVVAYLDYRRHRAARVIQVEYRILNYSI